MPTQTLRLDRRSRPHPRQRRARDSSVSLAALGSCLIPLPFASSSPTGTPRGAMSDLARPYATERSRCHGQSGSNVEELVGMIERGELRLPEMQRRYVWRSTRVRDLLDCSTAATLRGQSCCGKPTKRCRCRSSPSSSREPLSEHAAAARRPAAADFVSAVIRGEPVPCVGAEADRAAFQPGAPRRTRRRDRSERGGRRRG